VNLCRLDGIVEFTITKTQQITVSIIMLKTYQYNRTRHRGNKNIGFGT